MEEGLSDRNYLSAHEDRELVLNQASRWLQEHRNDDIGPALLVRDLFDLAAQPPPPPATISLSRSQFYEQRWQHHMPAPGSHPAGLLVGADLRAADALLAAAGLAWKAEEAEAGEGGPEQAVGEESPSSRWVERQPWYQAVRDVNEKMTAREAELRRNGGPFDPPPGSQQASAQAAWGRLKANAGAAETVPYWQGPWTPWPTEAMRQGATIAEARRRHEACEAEFAEMRRQEADAVLGAKMRELLGQGSPPDGLAAAIKKAEQFGAWAWLRRQAGLIGGEEAGQAARLPEQIGWALDELDNGEGRMEVRLMMPPGADRKAVYAEAVRRYNLHRRIEELARGWLSTVGPDSGYQRYAGKWSAARELLSLLGKGMS